MALVRKIILLSTAFCLLLPLAGYYSFQGYGVFFKALQNTLPPLARDGDLGYAPTPPALGGAVEDIEPALSFAEFVQLRRFLLDREYEKLTARFETLQQAYLENPTDERRLVDAFTLFDSPAPEYEPIIRDWKERFPESAVPHLAAGLYYYARGWQARGNKLARETTEEQFAGLEMNLALARQHCSEALRLTPNLLPAHILQIGIANTVGSTAEENQIVAQALDMFPHSFLIHHKAITAKLPRWGGSYPEMEHIAEHGERYSAENPIMAVLPALISIDQADRLQRDNNLSEAEQRYNLALSYGEYWSFYYEYAEFLHYYAKDFGEARRMVDKSIALRPANVDAYLLKTRIAFSAEDFGQAKDSLDLATRLSPRDPDILSLRQWAASSLAARANTAIKANRNQADQLVDLAFAFDRQSPEAHYAAALNSARENDMQSAEYHANLAMSLKPDDYNTYLLVDLIFAQQQKWGAIIPFWNSYIERHPKSGEAYFQRAGTYHHMGQEAEAVADLTTACTLGESEACATLKRVR